MAAHHRPAYMCLPSEASGNYRYEHQGSSRKDDDIYVVKWKEGMRSGETITVDIVRLRRDGNKAQTP